MADLFSGPRKGPLPQALHFSYEKAGLVLDNQPIPWNAEAVLVEAQVRLHAPPQQAKKDFVLRVATAEYTPETVAPTEAGDQARLFFRLPVPEQSVLAELFWRERSLGQLTLPLLSQQEFRKTLHLHMPTLSVRLRDQTLACQTFINQQCQGLVASAILQGGASLAPIVDLGLRVDLGPENGAALTSMPLTLSSTQLRGKQALLATMLPKPRRMGAWQVTWFLGDEPLAVQRIKAISEKQFLRSLRISATRFVLQDAQGKISLARYLPSLKDLVRVGPCFLVCSSEPGMAGLSKLRIYALNETGSSSLLQEQEMVVTDGPTPLVPGTLDIADLTPIQAFELRHKDGVIGMLPLTPIPTANFTGEGGYQQPQNFTWSSLAEEQLHEKLTRLLGDGNGKPAH